MAFATVQRHPARVDRLDEGREGAPEAHVVAGAARHAARRTARRTATAPRRGEGVEVGEETVGHGVGHPGVDVGRAVAPTPGRQPRRPGRERLLALEQPLLAQLPHLAHVEHPTTQDPEVGGGELPGLRHEVRLGAGRHAVGQVVRQVVERPHQCLGLRAVDLAGAQGAGDLRATAGPAPRRVAGRWPRLAPVEPHLGGQPRGGVARAVLLRQVVGGVQHAQPQLVEPVDRTRQADQHGRLLLGAAGSRGRGRRPPRAGRRGRRAASAAGAWWGGEQATRADLTRRAARSARGIAGSTRDGCQCAARRRSPAARPDLGLTGAFEHMFEQRATHGPQRVTCPRHCGWPTRRAPALHPARLHRGPRRLDRHGEVAGPRPRLGVPSHQVGSTRLIGGRPPRELWRRRVL